MTSVDLSIVVPVYKEANNIKPFLARMQKVLGQAAIGSYEIIFCLDPSPDNTEQVILESIQQNSNIKLVVFSRRFGQPAATMAGILYCHGEHCAVIDVDLQDPPELIPEMLAKMAEGHEVVYAKRRSRKGETLVKRCVSYMGYAVINRLGDVQIPRNTGDFRVMSRRVIEELRHLNETHGFLRGLVAYVGFKQTFIEYDRDERFSGAGNYNRFLGSLKIGLNGLISFSSRPLQLMSLLGAFFAGLSFLLGAWYVLQKLLSIELTPGLSTTIVIVTFFSGIQLLSLGLMGEYIGRIYDQVKKRPLYIIDRVFDASNIKKGGGEMTFTTQFLAEAKEVIGGINEADCEACVDILAETKKNGGRLFILGVGGSAGNASHAVNDFRKIVGLEAYAPTDNVSELTARTNDEGWETVFAKWLATSRLNAKDTVLIFSVGGGNLENNVSPNLVAALKYAKEVEAKVIGIVGRDGGYTKKVADACVIIPTINNVHVTPHAEAFQGVVWHLWVSHPKLKEAQTKWESVTYPQPLRKV